MDRPASSARAESGTAASAAGHGRASSGHGRVRARHPVPDHPRCTRDPLYRRARRADRRADRTRRRHRRRLSRRLAGYGADADHRRVSFLSKPHPCAGLRGGPGAGDRKRGHRHRPDVLATLCAHRARGDHDDPQQRFHRGRPHPGRRNRPDPVPACHAALRVVPDRARDARHGGHHPDRGRARVSGFGRPAAHGEWGAMVSSGRRYILDQWWVATIPGLAIFIVSLAFNLLGDGLRDVLDPRQKR